MQNFLDHLLFEIEKKLDVLEINKFPDKGPIYPMVGFFLNRNPMIILNIYSDEARNASISVLQPAENMTTIWYDQKFYLQVLRNESNFDLYERLVLIWSGKDHEVLVDFIVEQIRTTLVDIHKHCKVLMNQKD